MMRHFQNCAKRRTDVGRRLRGCGPEYEKFVCEMQVSVVVHLEWSVSGVERGRCGVVVDLSRALGQSYKAEE